MPEEIELSIMSPTADQLQPLLDEFTATEGIVVRLRLLSWDGGWNVLHKTARTHTGPDLSEIGSTWLGDLIGMQALHPFSAEEIAFCGGAAAFVPAIWSRTHLQGQSEVWAIPWLAGARLLFFRRSLLERAGVDPAHAFGSAAQLDKTLARLQAAGVPIPWIVPVGSTHTTLLNIASWVWGAGGDFLSPDGSRVLLNEPEARAGMRAYYALGRYLTPTVRQLTGEQPDLVFMDQPEAALTLSGPWLFDWVRSLATPPAAADVAVALPPGPSFVGGSHLVIWQHARQPAAALKLVRFLTSAEVQVEYCQAVGLLPVTHAALATPAFAADPFWQHTLAGVATGRSLPVVPSWGMLEYRLVATFSAIWADLRATPAGDIDTILERHLGALVPRLNQLLGQSAAR